MIPRTYRLGPLAAALVIAALAVPASAQAVNVYAAASVRDAFPQIGSATFNFAGSNQLQQQIERGAPADVFASASPAEAQALFRAGRCTRPVTFATNVVVLLVPESNPGNVKSVYSLRSGGRRLAIGTAGVPIGDYTRKLLRRMRLTSILSSNTVSQESNVSSIVSKVALGSADAGFAYVTDGKIAADRTKTIRLPSWAQPPVRYQICRVRRSGADSSGAKSFISKVLGSKGRRVLRAGGFGLPPRG
jgi:molybdate transport system substrate-binding protein